METQLGKNIVRKEAWSKVTGAAQYTADRGERGMLFARLLTSPHAHAQIVSVDTSPAAGMPGVKAVVTGADADFLCGVTLRDRPPLARGKVRYFGEPVALVVADSEARAKAAADSIRVIYRPLPVVGSVAEALRPGAPLIHDDAAGYRRVVADVYPTAGTNLCHSGKIRKGDMDRGWRESHIVVEGSFHLPQSAHAAMETRVADCKVYPDGRVHMTTATQAPFSVKEDVSDYFRLDEGNMVVTAPLVGGGFGGKAAVFAETLAYMAARRVVGRRVRLAITREEDMATAPCRIGLTATCKVGFAKDGKIQAACLTYYLDCGAYAEIGPGMAKAIMVDCAGPYRIDNLQVNCHAVYTNHTLVTSFRGFGHLSGAFCIERMMDKGAAALGLDAFEIRRLNAIRAGDLTPTQVKATLSNTGNLDACLSRLRELMQWDEGARIQQEGHLVRAKGIACFSKTSNSQTNAQSAALVGINKDGSVNLNFGAVEMGPGMRTTMAQLLAEKLGMSVDRVFVPLEVDTQTTPKHWKTVASITTILAGRAVLAAADDVIAQLKRAGAVALRCPPEDLEVGEEKVYVRADPAFFVAVKDVAHGFRYPGGNTVMGPIQGRGSYVMNHLTLLDPLTGKGKPGLSWTVGAQGVEIEYDTRLHTFRLLRAATVLDAGKVLNPKTARGLVMGGMCMGLGIGVGECYSYGPEGDLETTSFRTYKMLRFGETPDYLVDFVETPQIDTPFGARGIAEHGIIAIPAALAGAMSRAGGLEIDRLPISPEQLWRESEARA